MKRARLWFIFSMALLFVTGTAAVGFAAAKPAAKKASAKAAAAEPTRDMRTLFGHNVEGLAPVTISYVSDGVFNGLGDAMLVNFMKLVETESKGKIKIDAHRFGSLYRTNDFPKVIPIGTVHIGGINKGLLMSRENGYAPWIIGYIWKNPEHAMALTSSQEWYDMEDRLAKGKWNMKMLANANIGNWDYWSREPITSLAGFKGKKVWSYGELSNAYISAWGGTPVMKSFGETYMAYYNNALNVMSASIGLYHDFKFYEGGRYYLNMPVYPPGSVGIHYYALYMNRDKWNSLATPYKKILLDAIDLLTWAGTFESICMEKLQLYRLINQYKVVDLNISGKYPKEYEKIKKAAVEAGKKFVFSRGTTQQQWDETQAILTKYTDPKITSKYSWWFKLAWAESDRRLAEITKALKAGKSWEEAYDPYHAKHRYNWPVEKVKKEWLATPRIKTEWSEASRLQ